jgi:hypothetical protein
MKSKKFSKKLLLSKRTIVNLNHDELCRVKGGMTPACSSPCIETKYDPICPSYRTC